MVARPTHPPISLTTDALGTLAVAHLSACKGITEYPSLTPSTRCVVWTQATALALRDLCLQSTSPDLRDLAGQLDIQANFLSRYM